MTCRRSPSRRARSPRATARTTPSPTRRWPCWRGSRPRPARRSTCRRSPTTGRPSMPCCGCRRLGTILKRIEMLPQAELGPLVNLAVLAQAVVVALLVLRGAAAGRAAVPRRRPRGAAAGGLFRRARARLPGHRDRADRAGQLLPQRPHHRLRPGADRHAGVLRPGQHAGRAVRGARAARRGAGRAGGGGLVRGCCWPGCSRSCWRRSTCRSRRGRRSCWLLLAPVSVALGLPFPLGLSRMGHGGFLPWAWGLNGAFSVVATPLANLIAIKVGL